MMILKFAKINKYVAVITVNISSSQNVHSYVDRKVHGLRKV